MSDTEFYDVLGVSKSASQDEIRVAYKKLARQYHPDVKPDDKEAAEKFKQIQEAYDVLGDAEKRAKYDQFGAGYTIAAPPAAVDTPPSASSSAEGLPDEFELTPELVEEEAIRGDFVLRWAAILLAFLVACTTISQTATLVHVKAGQYLAANGVIPDGTDPFAYTTEGRVWRNQAWLFDLALAGVYGLGGDVGLTVFKALLAAAVFWCVVNISRPNTSTWWNAMIAAAGAIACIPFLTARPEIVTLLGCALTLYFLNSWRYSGRDKINFRLPVLFLVWCNLDPRMFLGLLIMVVYAIGESLRRKDCADAPLLSKGALWSTCAACFASALLNPFGWHSLTAAVDLYTVADPLHRATYAAALDLDTLKGFNLLEPTWWEFLTVPFVTALALGGLAVISLYLNYTSVTIPEILLLLAFGGLAFATGREIGPAIVVMCVVANLNCQDWYRESFSQSYSVSRWELLFSRGGRAITVLALVGCAWVTMKGIVYRGYDDVVGFGFEQVLATALTGFEDDLGDQLDNRPFNFNYEQGDTLIWAGQRVFIDSRLPLFTGTGEDDLIDLHDRTRRAIRQKIEGDDRTGRPEVWQATFDRYEITHAIPRLSGLSPDYQSYLDLLVEPRFQLTQLGPSVAVYYRIDSKKPELVEYLAEHTVNFVDLAFRQPQDEIGLRGVFPRPPDLYAKYLTAERISRPADLSLAMHYVQHLGGGRIQVPEPALRFAFAYLAIRHCDRTLVEDPNNPVAFSILGTAYRSLLNSEMSICRNFNLPYNPSPRYYQAMLAFNQSLVAKPDNILVHELLRTLYIENNRLDLAIESCHRVDALALADPDLSLSDGARSNRELLEQLEDQVEPILETLNKQINEKKIDYVQAVNELMGQGLHRNALLMLEQHAAPIDQQNPAYPVYGMLLLENGRIEEAYDILIGLEDVFLQNGLSQQLHYAAVANLAHGDFARAANLFDEEGNVIQNLILMKHLRTLPIVADFDRWSFARYREYAETLGNDEEQLVQIMWQRATTRIEAGQNEKAAEILQNLLEVAPDTPMRLLVTQYLLALTGKAIDPVSPSDRIPVTADMFAPDPAPANE